MEILGYAASLLIGLTLGLLGGGGSILSIPVLVYLFGVEPVRASAYSLFIVGTASFIGSLVKHREGLVSLRTGLLFGIPSVVSIFCTRKWLVPMLPDTLITYGTFVLTKRMFILGFFAILMFAAAMPMIRRAPPHQAANVPKPFVQVALQGISIGFITGLVGAGGGFLIIPALIILTGLPFRVAAGTSLMIISMNSLIGFLGDALNYSMDWPFLILVTSLAILGIFVGTLLAKRVPGSTLKRSLGWFILATGTYILFRELG